MRAAIVALVALTPLAVAAIQPAEAQFSSSRNPYCIRDGIGGRGTWDCSYHTWQQCLESAHGAGGWCTENPNYRPRKAAPRKRTKRR
jgi:hypothetical protein